MAKTRILIIDDSAIVRGYLSDALSRQEDFEVIGTAPDPYIGREKIAREKPDVIILDIEMPKMDGITFLKYLMRSLPIPVIIISSLLKEQGQLVMDALRAGAVDVVPKPGGPFSIEEVIISLVEKIRSIEINRFLKNLPQGEVKRAEPLSAPSVFSKYRGSGKMIVIGASTGGTTALEKLVSLIPGNCPPILTVIHMPGNFTGAFADLLNGRSGIRIKEAEDGEAVRSGCMYIAPGDYHMVLLSRGTDFILKLKKGPKVNNCRPSVDVLFESVAEANGRNSCGVILTGMGRDGAAGLLEIKKRGGRTIAQDEETSIVYGMPRAAVEMGAADSSLPLMSIIPEIFRTFLNQE